MNESLVRTAAHLLIKNGAKAEDIWQKSGENELTAFGAITIAILLTEIATKLAKKVIEK